MRAKKSMGQNFLKSPRILAAIVAAGEVKEGDMVLEIGPGKGALTEKILESGATVIAVEKDDELFTNLKEKFKAEIKSKKLILLNEDILEFKVESYKVEKYKIIANIPYNITGAILKKFLTASVQPDTMILMIQEEVGKRIMARDKKESILSISVKAYGEPKLVMKVEASYFSPSPKVDSVVIAIKNISRKLFQENQVNEEKFWEIVKKGFAHKRKKLSGNLKGICQGQSLTEFGNKRAEDLTLKDWIEIAKN